MQQSKPRYFYIWSDRGPEWGVMVAIARVNSREEAIKAFFVNPAQEDPESYSITELKLDELKPGEVLHL
jgi:hypothetical protein